MGDQVRVILICFPLKLMVEVVARIFQGIELLRWGVVTNWWGLGCPAHCGSASFASWALAFILGLCCGFCTCAVLGYHLLGFYLRVTAPHHPTPSGANPSPHRLGGYVYEWSAGGQVGWKGWSTFLTSGWFGGCSPSPFFGCCYAGPRPICDFRSTLHILPSCVLCCLCCVWTSSDLRAILL